MRHPVIGLYNMLIRVKVSTKEGMGDCNPAPWPWFRRPCRVPSGSANRSLQHGNWLDMQEVSNPCKYCHLHFLFNAANGSTLHAQSLSP